MYARRIDERELTFDFVAGLKNDNLLIADRETGSVWSQLEGEAISGPLAGTPLPIIPAMQTTWRHWRARYPTTRVMVDPEQEGQPYFYFADRAQRREAAPGQHDASRLGLGLVLGGEAIYLPLAELVRGETPLRTEVGGRTIIVHHGAGGLAAWAESGSGELLPGVLAYETGWFGFFPDSRRFEADR